MGFLRPGHARCRDTALRPHPPGWGIGHRGNAGRTPFLLFTLFALRSPFGLTAHKAWHT